jgi:hypothetical protein
MKFDIRWVLLIWNYKILTWVYDADRFYKQGRC